MNLIKHILTLALVLFTTITFAQSNRINYQGLASDSNGSALVNATITIDLEIKFGTPTGIVEYSESHNVTTDANGVFSLQIGNGTVISGDYNALIWNDNAFLTTSINGTEVGTTEFHAVPFALNSGDSVWAKNGNNIYNTNTGRVGIGTNSPGAKLMVVGEDDTTTTPAVNIANNSLTSLLHIKNDGKVGIGTTSPGAKFMVVGTNGFPVMNILNDGATPTNPAMRINDNGHVGIGTTSPGARFMVVGQAGAPVVNILNDGSNPTNPALRINENGRVGIGTTSPGAKLMVVGEDDTATTPAVNIANNSLTSLFHIKNDGKVGIGTTSPTAPLHVVGIQEFTDNNNAIANGLTTGAIYRTGDVLKIVHN